MTGMKFTKEIRHNYCSHCQRHCYYCNGTGIDEKTIQCQAHIQLPAWKIERRKGDTQCRYTSQYEIDGIHLCTMHITKYLKQKEESQTT